MLKSKNQLNFDDRFIPRRKGMNVEALNYVVWKDKSLAGSPEHESTFKRARTYENQAYVQWQKNLLKDMIWSNFPLPTKILKFSEGEKTASHIDEIKSYSWPVRARKKPLIGRPRTILDMPNLEENMFHHITDWGRNGYIASVFEGEVYLWDPKTKSPSVVTDTGSNVHNCIRWNYNATRFAASFSINELIVYDCLQHKIVHEASCICLYPCGIHALEFSKSNDLISGCSGGRLLVWSPQLELKAIRCLAHQGPIIRMALSCNERFLATTGFDGSVRIWYWPSLKENFKINYPSPVRSIAWHPWKDSILATGGGVGNGSISIWNVCNHVQLDHKSGAKERIICVDCLAWNSITGELAASYWHKTNDSNESKSTVAILSNLHTTVDLINWHVGRVMYLLWGDGGRTLATAGTDENLFLWDFFGSSLELNKKYKILTKTKKDLRMLL